MSDLSLVVLAAGQGRRFGGLKQLTPFGPTGEFLMDYALHDALAAGVTRAVLVVASGHEAEFAERVVAPWRDRLPVHLVAQRPDDLPAPAPAGSRDRPWGTGHALWCARHAVGGPFLVCNADDFYGRPAYRAVVQALGRETAAGTYVLQGYDLPATLPPRGTYSRAVCDVTSAGWLRGITEHLGLTRRTAAGSGGVASLNFWGFRPDVFALLADELAAFLDGVGDQAGAEFFLPAAVQAGLASGRCRVRVLPSLRGWCGVTGPADAAAVRAHLADLHRQGVYPAGGLR